MKDSFLHKIKIHVEQIMLFLFSLIPLKNTILFESEGDFSDNSYAFFEFLKVEGYFKCKYKPVWLVDKAKNDQIICVPKHTRLPNFRRLYYMATSKYYIFDHCNVMKEFKIRKNQRIINLFHGCTFKTTKGLVEKAKSAENMMTVTGDFWKSIMADFVQCKESIVISLGYPRNDYFFEHNEKTLEEWNNKHKWSNFKKVILWMPTFRKSYSSVLSEDYYTGDTGLPILEKNTDLEELNDYLKEKMALMVFKVHHLQSDYKAFRKQYSNIQILKDEDIISCNVQLYQIITLADVLITDYSSISNDFLLLNRPIIFTLDDYEDYRHSRGFSIDDPAQYFPGYHIFNKMELFLAIDEVIEGVDTYAEVRKKILPIMHKYQDGNSSKRIASYIGLS